MASVERLLSEHQPRLETARPEFRDDLRHMFIAGTIGLRRRAPPVASTGWPLAGWPATRRAMGRRLAAATAALGTVAMAALAISMDRPVAPPAIARHELIARNEEAWSGLQTLAGAFVTGDGWYYEEWISRGADGVLRYKRYIRPPDRTPNRAQWNVSDGHTEWVVDASSNLVRSERAAVPGDMTRVAPNDAMQCTSLALPAGQGAGAWPVPVLLDARPAYRLEGTLPDGAPAVYWLDAEDYLVIRIDRPTRGTVWERRHLEWNPPLPAAAFRPDSLTNL